MQPRLLLFVLGVVICAREADIGRIAVDERAIRSRGYRILIAHGRKLPIAFGDFLLHVFELVHDFRDLCLGESVVFMPVWDVVAVLAVEPHEPVEARPVEKEKIIGVMRFVEPIADFIEVIPPPRFQASAL